MKSPLWILNISLVFLLFIAALLMYLFLPVELPRVSLIAAPVKAAKEDVSPIDEVRIYENDPFNTSIKPVIKTEEPKEQEIAIPQPPEPLPPQPLPRITPEFLPPLPVKLKGVLFNSNPLYSRAIVASTKTKEERLVKIGDMVEDSLLTAITREKIIFTRSNGQQETIFLWEESAQDDPEYLGNRDWSHSIKRQGASTFRVDGRHFKERVRSLAQFIDLLDITTAYEDGKNVGYHIGQFGPNSLGSALGLQYDDVITSINGISATSTKERADIYQSIVTGGKDQIISVTIKRGGVEEKLTYKIFHSEEGQEAVDEMPTPLEERLASLPSGTPIPPTANGYPTPPQTAFKRTPQNKKLIQNSLATARGQEQVAEDYRRRDQKSMINYGGRDAFLQR